MMMNSRGRTQQIQNLLFWTHTFVFGLMCLFTLAVVAGTADLYARLTVGHVMLLLVWMLVYMFHLASFARASGHVETHGDDRQSYREGLRDGIREAMALQMQGRSPDRLMLDEDGDLAGLVEAADKRKRR